MTVAGVVAVAIAAGAIGAWRALVVAWLADLAKRDGITPEEMREKLGLPR